VEIRKLGTGKEDFKPECVCLRCGRKVCETSLEWQH